MLSDRAAAAAGSERAAAPPPGPSPEERRRAPGSRRPTGGGGMCDCRSLVVGGEWEEFMLTRFGEDFFFIACERC